MTDRNRMTKAAAMAAILAALGLSVPANAHEGRYRPYGGGYYSDGYRSDYRPGDYYRDARVYRGDERTYRAYRPQYRYDYRYRCRNDGAAGTIVGAIAGGLIGSAAAGRHGDKTAGVIAGGAIGALAGRAIDKSGNRC